MTFSDYQKIENLRQSMHFASLSHSATASLLMVPAIRDEACLQNDIMKDWSWSPRQLQSPVTPTHVFPVSQPTERSLSGNHMYEIYAEYSDIVSTSDSLGRTKARLAALLSFAESQGLTGRTALEDLQSLMGNLHWELVDARRFTLFYQFIFFMCREKGQKSITINTAIAGWKMTLSGRFRLLDQWCSFVQANKRHAIPEDTWRQVLEFSRVVHEDLSNYDPEGAWPVLVDEFVEDMYGNSMSSCCTSGADMNCDSTPAWEGGNLESLLPIRTTSLPGMTASAGSKRRRRDQNDEIVLTKHLKRLLIDRQCLYSPNDIACHDIVIDEPDNCI